MLIEQRQLVYLLYVSNEPVTSSRGRNICYLLIACTVLYGPRMKERKEERKERKKGKKRKKEKESKKTKKEKERSKENKERKGKK